MTLWAREATKQVGWTIQGGEFIITRSRHSSRLKDRLGDQRGGSEWEPIKILLEGD
jgi:hypothetical protein